MNTVIPLDRASQEELAEALLADMASNLELIDPTDDTEELLSLVDGVLSTEEGQKFLAFLLGVEYAEDWFSEFG